jgi:F-type H+-transporting ATPase subunit delta
MYQQLIARRYAKGLILSAKNLELESIESDLKALVDALEGEAPDLHRLLMDPAFSPLERKAVIKRLKDAFHMNDKLYHFLLLLIDRGRIMLLPKIHEAFLMFVDQRRGRVRAFVKSATPVDAMHMNEIKDSLSTLCQKEVVTKATIIPELLGGIRVEMGGLIFDGTLRAKLDAMKSRLLNEVSTI